MTGPFFPPHPQGPADLTDIAGINQTFDWRIKPDDALRDGATAPAACYSGLLQKKCALAWTLVNYVVLQTGLLEITTR